MAANQSFFDEITEEAMKQLFEHKEVFEAAAKRLYYLVGNESPYSVALANDSNDQPELEQMQAIPINTMRETTVEVVTIFLAVTAAVAAKGLQGKLLGTPLHPEWMDVIFGAEFHAVPKVQALLEALRVLDDLKQL